MAERQHGVVGRGQLLELGLTVKQIEGRLGRGQLQRVFRGAYSVGHRCLSREGHSMAVVLAAGRGAVLSHRSAAASWRLIPAFSGIPEATAPRGWRSAAGLLVHRAVVAADETTIDDGIPVTSVPRTFLDLATLLDMRQLERAWNEMEARELRDRLSVPDLLARHPGRRGVAKLRALLASDEPGGVTRNELEEAFVALLDRHGLPRGRINADLALRGRFIEVDCLWERQRLAVELDGGGAHRTRRAFQSDRLRDRTLVAEGWRPMRVTWHQLRDEPEAIVADLRLALYP